MGGIFSLAGMQQMGVILAFKDAYSAQMTAFDRKLAGLSARTTARGRTMGAAFLPVAKGVSVAGAATVLGLGLATKTAVDFHQKMAEVKTMMLDQLEYYPAIERAVRGTATAYGQSHEAAAEAAYFLLSAGVKASKVPLALKASAMEATAGLASLNTVADIGTTVINAYGWEAERLDDVFDKLQMTVVLGKTRLDELASSAGRAYSIAAPLGVAFEQVNVAMAGVTKA
ncbi:MAG: phage tail tape measure protein, partial [bacterium]